MSNTAVSIPPVLAGRPQVDPRGQRFAATVTALILAAVLVLAPGPIATSLLAAQTLLFAVGAGLGVRQTPHAWVFQSLVRPRLGPPAELEDAAPPRFAQGVGLVFAAVGLVGLLAGLTTLGLVATGFALAAAVLNAAFGLCLGCELYLLLTRLTRRGTSAEPTTSAEPKENSHVA
jgi:disulfide bond formation protein DsbB